MKTLIDATGVEAVERVAIHVDVAVGRLFQEDAHLAHLLTHAVELADRPTTPEGKRGHAIARVIYTWLRREHDDREAMALDIETLAPLGRSDRWKATIRTWALIARTDPDMFFQHATYANFAAVPGAR